MINIINVSNQMPFGLLFVNYSLLAGLAGGLGVTWAICNQKPTKNSLPQLVAIALALCATFNVLAEVQQQGRLIYGLTSGWENWNGSIIKYGVPAIPTFMGLLLLTVFAPYSAVVEKLYNPLRAAIVILGLFLPAYSGIWMMNEHGVALWNSPLTVILTSLTGVSAGAVLYNCLDFNADATRNNVLRTLLLTSLAMVLLASWWASHFAGTEVHLSSMLLATHFSGLELSVVAGFIVALALLTVRNTKRSTILAFVFSAIAAYSVRYCLLVGGEGVSRSGGGLSIFVPDLHELFFTGASLLLSGGLFAALLLIVPATLQRFED
ncbi:hypothetical protein [Vibrio gallicus]|uniref:hypothetical protein n=1 Tax=Vibrio gallicus TaxID=190897 RepID=UPI0021C3FCFE|nr:hypothetical protein [Vibrio gallicus]